jgi:transcriptional regulator with XRE-family HTH domain
MVDISSASSRDLAWVIKSIRDRQGLSQERLAKLLNCTQNTISRYERATHTPPIIRLRKLLELATEQAEIEAVLGQLRSIGAIFSHDFNTSREPDGSLSDSSEAPEIGLDKGIC